jgi:hypothetical protein
MCKVHAFATNSVTAVRIDFIRWEDTIDNKYEDTFSVVLTT